MGQVFGSDGNVTMVDGSRVVLSNTRRPALLLPDAAVVLSGFDISYPDYSKSNAYGLDKFTDFIGNTQTACVSYASINPQEWDSGHSFVCDLPSSANYFEVQVSLTRTVEPSSYLGQPMPKAIAEGQSILLDGASAIVERIGPIVRLFRFEQVGAAVYLRRKQSVADLGNRGIWTPGNAVYDGAGGKLEGWTYGGSPNAFPAYQLDAKFGIGSNINKARGEANACSLSDISNYASTWSGTVIITPGYIEP